MYIDSGDICIMMNESRVAYHAVPKILSRASVDGAVRPPQPGNAACDTSLDWAQDDVKHHSLHTSDTKDDVKHHSLHTSDTKEVSPRRQTTDGSRSDHSERVQDSSLSCDSNSLVLDKGVNKVAKQQPSEESNACSSITDSEKKLKGIHDSSKTVNQLYLTTTQHLDWKPYEEYLNHSRINMNIRQVFKSGQTFRIQHCGSSE